GTGDQSTMHPVKKKPLTNKGNCMPSGFKIQNIHQSQSGMSLVSVIVAIGIGGIMVVGLASVFKNSLDAQNRITQLASSSNIRQIAQTIIGNQKSCATSLNLSNYKPENNKRQDIKLYNSAGQVVLQAAG